MNFLYGYERAARHAQCFGIAFALSISLLITRPAGETMSLVACERLQKCQASTLSDVIQLLAVASSQSFWDSLPRNAEVTHVPHFNGTLPSELFSGYISLPGSAKQLFYILVLSQRNPDSDPLVFW